MIYLLLSVAASSIIFIIFKLFAKYEINTLQAIVINYFVAFTAGMILYTGDVAITNIPSQPWFYSTLALGALFILTFNLMAMTTQRSGLSVVSVATKMSVVIPIVFGVFYYRESLSALKITGIIAALIAVYLASLKAKDGITIKKKDLVLPLLVFLGSGAIDTGLKFTEGAYVQDADVPIFSATIFGIAGSIGLLIFGYQLIRGTFSFQLKNVIAGICLGVPNYFSIYMLVKALRYPHLTSAVIFTINNVAIVIVSTFLGILLFKERLIKENWIGILLAVLSILLVSLA